MPDSLAKLSHSPRCTEKGRGIAAEGLLRGGSSHETGDRGDGRPRQTARLEPGGIPAVRHGETTGTLAEEPHGDHWVYRCFDAEGQLLYVGLTSKGFRRHRNHARAASWWRSVARIEVDHFDTRDEAQDAEVEQIRGLSPLHNKVFGAFLPPRDPAPAPAPGWPPTGYPAFKVIEVILRGDRELAPSMSDDFLGPGTCACVCWDPT